MGTGIVFVYLLILALVAPVIWVLWWGAESLAGGRMRPAPVVLTHRTAPVREQFPDPVDLNLASRTREVTIYNLRGRELDTCDGPDRAGRCPHPDADGVVPCSGCVLALPRPIRGSFEWQIPAGYHSCLLGSYAAFRQSQ